MLATIRLSALVLVAYASAAQGHAHGATNKRDDAYGGPIENRARLLMEATDAAIGVWGASRVGMHLAPRGDAHDMGDSDPAATFGYVARELGKRKLAFIAAREALGPGRIGPMLKQEFTAAGGGSYVANERFTLQTANEVRNAPSRHLNAKHGYVLEPGVVIVRREL